LFFQSTAVGGRRLARRSSDPIRRSIVALRAGARWQVPRVGVHWQAPRSGAHWRRLPVAIRSPVIDRRAEAPDSPAPAVRAQESGSSCQACPRSVPRWAGSRSGPSAARAGARSPIAARPWARRAR